MKFSERRSKKNFEICMAFGLAFLLSLIFSGCAILIIEVAHANGNDCGIPLHLWLDIYFVIVIVGALIALNIVWMAYTKHYWAYPFEIWRRIVFGVIFAGWIVYGYVLYFSDDNNC